MTSQPIIAAKDAWLATLRPGNVVCDCRYQHVAIKEIDLENDYAILADGFRCSPFHCLDQVPHPDWSHPDV